MSFSITPSDIIRKHPTNHSTSKEVHQFSKTTRFLGRNPDEDSAYDDEELLLYLFRLKFYSGFCFAEPFLLLDFL